MKVCSRCKRELPKSSFYVIKNGTLRSWCKECHAEDARRRYGDTYYHRERHKKAVKETQAFISNFKSGKPCKDCGKIFDPFVMEFDHRDPLLKLMNISNMARRRYSIVNILKEIEKCDLVCANCHRIRTHLTAYNKRILLELKRLETPENYRFCEICEKPVIISKFVQLKNGKPAGWCIDCENNGKLTDQDYYRKFKNKLALNSSGSERLRFDKFKDVPCQDCGLKFMPFVMDFDHRVPELKTRNVSFYTDSFKTEETWNLLQNEIKKCDLVCANCHRLRGLKRKLILKVGFPNI